MSSGPAGQDLPRDPVSASIVVAERFDDAFRRKCGDDASAVARRLKEFPQILLQAGLTSALTFYASKLDDSKKWSIFIDALKAVTGGEAGGSLCREASGEGGGYPHALAVLLAYTAGHAGCDIKALLDIRKARSSFVACMDDIKRSGLALERLALAYASEVKKLFTALYSKE